MYDIFGKSLSSIVGFCYVPPPGYNEEYKLKITWIIMKLEENFSLSFWGSFL